MIKISHSEVEAYLKCKQNHFYAFGDAIEGYPNRGIEPLNFPDTLYRGQVGHEALEVFFKKIQEGGNIKEASDAGLEAAIAHGSKKDAKFEVLNPLISTILPNFFEQVAPEFLAKYTVQAVEKTFTLELPSHGVAFPFTPDLIVRDKMGRNIVVDHKFVYNFYSVDDASLFPQLSKYIGALRALSFNIHGGMYNMLRTRVTKDTSTEANFRQLDYLPSYERVARDFAQQLIQMEKIAGLRSGTLADWANEADMARVQNNSCKMCNFKTLCAIKIDGGDSKLYRKINFKPNSYGYNHGDE